MSKYFTSNFDGKKIIDFLKAQAEELQDLSPLMKVARVFLKHTVDENFETEGEHTGEKWKSWSETWKKRRIAMGRGDGRILNLDGHLRKSIIAKHGKDFAQVGTNKVYAAIHNFGGDSSLKKNKNMPKREFMRLDDAARENLQAELFIKAKELLIDKEIHKKVYGE